jgi:hypothetical protein
MHMMPFEFELAWKRKKRKLDLAGINASNSVYILNYLGKKHPLMGQLCR